MIVMQRCSGPCWYRAPNTALRWPQGSKSVGYNSHVDQLLENCGGHRRSHPTVAASMATPDKPMPAIMLCTAMRRVRFAMTIASLTRSSRSVRMTTSAASDEALAPLAPMAMPTPAAASAGASLMPSPTIRLGSGAARSPPHRPYRRAPGLQARNRDRVLPQCFWASSGDPREHHDPRHPGRAKQPDGTRCFRPQFICEQQCSNRATIDSNEDDQSRPPGSASERPHGPRRGIARAHTPTDVIPTRTSRSNRSSFLPQTPSSHALWMEP